ncbi:hypothetical protein L227DRAFT_371944 [Lentinus tigrinus ALCF2SS1-6]|uniref:Uncharacterized protein n=1 Tax=Lentinus tigrinus ALCF2SS1-6 TaxID=1328759 RepID=A0A5C2RU64_9APHY|nr:hypothetical protein L227DRAFT_371944 [Lentinus tigrinus ALCF2SS1-6]
MASPKPSRPHSGTSSRDKGVRKVKEYKRHDALYINPSSESNTPRRADSCGEREQNRAAGSCEHPEGTPRSANCERRHETSERRYAASALTLRGLASGHWRDAKTNLLAHILSGCRSLNRNWLYLACAVAATDASRSAAKLAIACLVSHSLVLQRRS